jgi:Flp pilus assembly protein TadG
MDLIKRHQQRRAASRRRGLATVEAALILPFVLYLTFGAIEYGWMFLKQQQITNVARQSARLAATPSATNGTVNARISTMMTDAGLGGSGYTVTMPANVAAVTPSTTFTVRVSVTYSNVTLTHMSPFIPVPTTLSSTIAMSKEGP